MNVMTGRPSASSQRSQAKLVASGNKRKLLNGEEIPGGLVIVRPPSSQGTRTSTRPPSQPPPDRPPSSNSHRPKDSDTSLPPPAKKFRSDSQPSNTFQSGTSTLQTPAGPSSSKHISQTQEIEADVRAMEDEADQLRRETRARALNPALRQEYHPPSRPPDPKLTTNGHSRKSRILDTTQTLPSAHSESPMIVKNKRLREGAMNAIKSASQEPESAVSSERGREATVNGSGGRRSHRRTSSVNGRGKRISESFEATGILSHPHSSISESSFFKHIDTDIPDSERLLLLLTWCTSRSAQSYASTANASDTTLPPLSEQEVVVLNKVQQDLLRQLAVRKIDIGPNPQSQSSSGTNQHTRVNEQNISNRKYEKQFSHEIRQMELEHESWKKSNYHYETLFKQEQVKIEKRKSDLSHRQALSAKAQGKQKASDDIQEDWSWLPSEHLPESQRAGFALSKEVLGLSADPSGSIRRINTGIRIGREDAEAKLKQEISDLPFNLDTLLTHVNAARATTNVAESVLNERFRLLSIALAARSGDIPDSSRAGTASATTRILNTYIPPAPSAPLRPLANAQSIFRALARVDSARPRGQIGDAARRAAREVHRMEESGIARSSERRLTEVPPTPKKVPMTPRRGTTPGRGNTPGR
ncbi:Mis12-Mtw1 protein family-domain-containing protein [Lentinula aciculospora]|uniref:Mis12-Mtw1 protein family-domain-containing protein n=1 Tax=Lentinula aciculospora TaxID=153920 RepID=A0A9W9DW05_9AGAR|nr:Mis12-Mtw1 protein family-domain-containing protein [Lentinula aciculospora]